MPWTLTVPAKRGPRLDFGHGLWLCRVKGSQTGQKSLIPLVNVPSSMEKSHSLCQLCNPQMEVKGRLPTRSLKSTICNQTVVLKMAFFGHLSKWRKIVPLPVDSLTKSLAKRHPQHHISTKSPEKSQFQTEYMTKSRLHRMGRIFGRHWARKEAFRSQ